MRVVFSVLCALFLALPAMAEEKKSGPGLTQRGVTSYVLLQTPDDQPESTGNAKVFRIELRDRNQVVAIVTIEAQSADDHIITFEPVIGEAFVIDALMSQMELTFRTAHERVTARFDKREVKWNRTGSESLFARVMPDVETAGLLLVELQERGLLASQVVPSTSSDTAKSPCGNNRFAGGVSSNLTQDPGTGGGDGDGLPCSGASYECSGGATTWTSACSKAKSSCNLTCWNRYCVGCCKFTTCMYACISAWCGASMTGTACAYGDRP
jgi:hypothetical protein